jgi:hypothetical protein
MLVSACKSRRCHKAEGYSLKTVSLWETKFHVKKACGHCNVLEIIFRFKCWKEWRGASPVAIHLGT